MVNILIVDDHQFVIDGIKSMLSNSTNYHVSAQALNGEQALSYLSSNTNIQLMITDISMPIMTGIELCAKVKSDFPTIKVLVLSMHSNADSVLDALDAEADGYLLKNTGQKDFLESIDRIMLDGACYSQELLPIIANSLKKKSTENSSIILSVRENEVLQLIMQEFTSKEIAEKLFISKQTVDTHRINIMAKTKSKTIVGLIKYAMSANLISK